MDRIPQNLFQLLKETAPLFHSPYHGLNHWKTVESNGLYLSEFSGADPVVVKYFAYFHDSRREDENRDIEHGDKAAAFIGEISGLLPLSARQILMLRLACLGHTRLSFPHQLEGNFDGHFINLKNLDQRTIGTCWDSDRLDLGRVGIVPSIKFLYTAEAKRIARENDFVVLERKNGGL